MPSQVMQIQTKTATRNEYNELVITFTEAFNSPPLLFLTPYWKGQESAVSNIPTITSISKTGATIYDANSANNYYLNVLAVNVIDGYLNGLPATTVNKPKQNGGVLEFDGYPAQQTVNLLSPYWNGVHSAVGNIETVNTILSSNYAAKGNVQVNTFSYNKDENYHVLLLSLAQSTTLNLQCGIVNKAGGSRQRIYFPARWESPPVVIVTPWWNNTIGQVGYVETISNITETYFDVVSSNAGKDYYINWLAHSPNDTQLNAQNLSEAFKHFYKHFPEQRELVEQHRKTFENIILTNGAATRELLATAFANQPSFPISTRSPASDRFITIAKIIFDSVALLLSTVGVVANVRLEALNALATELENGPTEYTPLLNQVDQLQQVISRQASAMTIAKKILELTKLMFTLNLLKNVLVALAQDVPWYAWVVSGISLLAQVTIFIAAEAGTGGAATLVATAAWTARIASLLTSGGSLYLDASHLYYLEHPSNETVTS